MPDEACPMPSRGQSPDAEPIRAMLEGKRIAVVGCSDKPHRASHRIAAYLLEQGYEVIPVHPRYKTVLGQTCYPALADVPGPIDVVDVFRRSDQCDQVTAEAIAVGAKGVWLQSGIRNERAAQLAGEAGIHFVQDRCIMVEHMTRDRR